MKSQPVRTAVYIVALSPYLTAAVAIALTAAASSSSEPTRLTAQPSLLDIANNKADVIILEELTPQLADALDLNGFKNAFPYQALEPGEYGSGVGIWSRYPITASTRIEGYRLKMVSADIAVPGTHQDTVFVAIHLPGPWPQKVDGSRDEIDRLPATLGEIKNKPTADPSSSPATSTPPTTWPRSAHCSPTDSPTPQSNPVPGSPERSQATRNYRRYWGSITS